MPVLKICSNNQIIYFVVNNAQHVSFFFCTRRKIDKLFDSIKLFGNRIFNFLSIFRLAEFVQISESCYFRHEYRVLCPVDSCPIHKVQRFSRVYSLHGPIHRKEIGPMSCPISIIQYPRS